MKHQTTTLLCSLLFFMLLSTTASAQLLSSNNLGIYPPGGPFNQNGQFTSIGESGGVPGPTVDGCDLYGFRAQRSLNRNVNLGMQFLNIFNGLDIPTLSFESSTPFWIVEKNPFAGSEDAFGCGRLLAYYNRSNNTTSSTVYTIIGSGIASGGMWQPSDRTLKRDIKTIPNALEMIQNLNGVTYEYLTEERPELNLPKGMNYGFITQEVAEIMPEAVQDAYDRYGNEADYDVMQYTAIIPVLTEAMKEQQDIIDGQDEVIKSLEDRMARLEKLLLEKGTPDLDVQNTPINATQLDGVSLRQNRPNPFRGTTTIEYTIPNQVTDAQLVVFDVNGKALNTYQLNPGVGSINYNATDLSSGVYYYAIVSNGKNIAYQKMVVK